MTAGPPRTVARAFAALVLGAGSFAGLMVAAGPASAATTTINCDTAAQPSADWTSCQKLTGTAKCVWNNGNGTYTLSVGYTNPTAYNLYASVPNANNAFTATSGSAANPGHADTFYPGVYTTAWTVTWSPTSKNDLVSWALMGHTFTWADTYTACPSKPVPVVGNAVVGSVGLALITGLAFIKRRRLRGLLPATRFGVTAG